MIVGFTGTRLGLLRPQHESLKRFMRKLAPTRFVHGDGGHADALAHQIAESIGCYIEIFPSDIAGHVTYFGSSTNCEVFERMPPLARDRLMVRLIHGLIACPRTDKEELRSGTWATVRYAREIGLPIYIIRGNGSIVRDIDPVFN